VATRAASRAARGRRCSLQIEDRRTRQRRRNVSDIRKSQRSVCPFCLPVSSTLTLTSFFGISRHLSDRNEHPEEQWGGLYEAEGGVAIGGDDDTANDSLQRYQGGSRWKCDENTTNSLAIFPERHAASNIESSRVATGKKAPIKNPFEDLDNDGDGDVIV